MNSQILAIRSELTWFSGRTRKDFDRYAALLNQLPGEERNIWTEVGVLHEGCFRLPHLIAALPDEVLNRFATVLNCQLALWPRLAPFRSQGQEILEPPPQNLYDGRTIARLMDWATGANQAYLFKEAITFDGKFGLEIICDAFADEQALRSVVPETWYANMYQVIFMHDVLDVLVALVPRTGWCGIELAGEQRKCLFVFAEDQANQHARVLKCLQENSLQCSAVVLGNDTPRLAELT
ncbi:MAG: hypothetical protein SH868_10740 [Bythopirellula sp.]|nr:hypothetical protein [Bythopirellula sp.]